MTKAITLKPTKKQDEAYGYLFDDKTRYVLFGGAAGGGKSWLAAEWLILNCIRYPDSRWFLARERLTVLKKSSLITIFKVCKHHGVQYNYREQQSLVEIYNGPSKSIIDLLEVKENPSDPFFEDLGSTEYTGGVLEEAGEITFGAFDTLRTRVGRHKNKEYNLLGKILITCNPKKNWLYQQFYKPWTKNELSDDHAFVQSFVADNQYLDDEYVRNLENISDRVKKQRLLFGVWDYDDSDDALMNYDSIIDLFTNTITGDESKYITADIARFGSDYTVFYLWHGFSLKKVWVYGEQGTDITKEKLKQIITDERVPFSRVLIDEVGVGGGVLDGLRGAKGFIANATPLPSPLTGKPENFRNLKDQMYYHLSDKVNNHTIAVAEDFQFHSEVEAITREIFKEYLIEELQQVKIKDPDKDGKRSIVGKEKVKELLGRSPDFSDTMMMRIWFAFATTITDVDMWRRKANIQQVRRRGLQLNSSM